MTKNSNNYILVYGATGLVGHELVTFLKKLEYQVVVLARNESKAKQLFGDNIVIISADEDVVLTSTVNYRCHAIVNLAGAGVGDKAWSASYKKTILDSRIQSIRYLNDLVKKMEIKPEVWIQASAIGYYGPKVIKPIDETGKKGEGFLANVVDEWEQFFKNTEHATMRKLILRIGIVMSHGGGFLKEMLKIANYGVVALPHINDQRISWIHISDLAKIIEKSINDQAYTGIVNVVSPSVGKMNYLKELLQKKSKALFRLNLPKLFFYIILGKEKTNEMVLANQNINSVKLKDFYFSYTSLDDIFDKA